MLGKKTGGRQKGSKNKATVTREKHTAAVKQLTETVAKASPDANASTTLAAMPRPSSGMPARDCCEIQLSALDADRVMQAWYHRSIA